MSKSCATRRKFIKKPGLQVVIHSVDQFSEAMHVLSTGAITALSDTSVRNQRHWQPNSLYTGYVHAIHEDGSIEVSINSKVYQALAHPSAQAGDFLSLRLLGTDPEPHFSIVGVLRHGQKQEAGVQVPSSWLDVVNLLRKVDPGLTALTLMWQRYPLELAKLSPQLPILLDALQEKILNRNELHKSGKLKAQVLSSGSFFESQHTDTPIDPARPAPPDLKGVLLRLLGLLHSGSHANGLLQQGQHGPRQLVLEEGLAVFKEVSGTAAQSLQGVNERHVALYASEQETSSGFSILKQLLTSNVESALLQLTNSQLAALNRSDDKIAIWIIQLLINYEGLTVPVTLEFCYQRPPATEQWQVAFSMELPRSGRIHAQLAVKKPAVMINLLGPHEEVLELWMQRNKNLKPGLEAAGLRLDDFRVAQSG